MRWNRIQELVRVHRWPLGYCVALSCFETVALLAMPLIAGKLADKLVGDDALTANALLPLLLALLFTQMALRVGNGVLLAKTSATITTNLKRQTYRHLQSLPMSFWHNRQRGDLMALLSHEVEFVTHFVTGTLLQILPVVISLGVSVAIMLSIEPTLAVPIIVGLPCFFLAMKLIGRKVRPIAALVREAYARSSAIADENLSLIAGIKAFNREGYEAKRFGRQIETLKVHNVRLGEIQAIIGPVVGFVAAAIVIVILWLATNRVGQGNLSPGELVALLLYAGLLTRPIANVAESWGRYQMAKGVLERLDHILDWPSENSKGWLRPTSIAGKISFQNVDFAYPGRSQVLSSFSLEIDPGEVVAVTGANGVGKSTIVNLLLRFYEPDSGRIELDGMNIADLDIHALRASIANVPQEPLLLNGTIKDNIVFGNPDATPEMIEAAAKSAQALTFIEGLPDGSQTVVGEQGVRLSGGQRQRLALARALVKDPKVMIFDEPTAMFDPAGEESFVQSVRAELTGKTVILITHRPASLGLADRIVRLGDGWSEQPVCPVEPLIS